MLRVVLRVAANDGVPSRNKMLMRAATVVQQLCKSCRTCLKFYCMFYFTCDRSFNRVTRLSRYHSAVSVDRCSSWGVGVTWSAVTGRATVCWTLMDSVQSVTTARLQPVEGQLSWLVSWDCRENTCTEKKKLVWGRWIYDGHENARHTQMRQTIEAESIE